eukprot:m.105144 g.105144  ORF g.105144 m.105144 type:complete len:242 (-) comp12635_c0_seq1:1356-2081(-)
MTVSVKLVALVGVVSLVAANEAELAGDTDPDGSKYGIEAFVRCGSSTGDFVIHAKKAWAPIGYSRFIELTQDPEYWPDQLIYRNIPGFIAQFGVPAKPETTAQWVEKPRLRDDVHIDRFASGKFRRGLVSFAGGGQDSRTHHLFISTGADAEFLGGAAHETPFGTIEGGPDGQGFKNILKWFNGAEAAEAEKEQHNYVSRGNGFMEPKFPMLDRINGCYIIHTLYPGHKEETLHQDKWDEL